MPWSITLCCTAILLISCRLCRRLLRALNISALSASVFLALVCLAELLPAVDVEELNRFDELTAGAAHDLFDLSDLKLIVADEREVARDRRELRQR